jgi:GTPase
MSTTIRNRAPSFAVVLSLQLPDQTDEDVARSRAELEQLLAGLGIRTVERMVQKRKPHAPIGAGKRDEIATLLGGLEKQHGTGSVILAVDGELHPGHLHQLENAAQVQVIDRTGIVLRVFEQRAQTPLARLEVKIARLAYEAPRVRDDANLGDAEGGGGRGGRGHTNVELEKQRIRDRLAQLRRQLASLSTRDERQRAGRRTNLRAAVVGYTNAGKSSLMRALTGSDVYVEDKLFATLGATVRAIAPATAPPILLSDTVGFIRNLPHELVASFRSTLAEAREAALLLHVVDASDPAWLEQMRVTRDSLIAVGAGEVPELVLLNKIDRVPPARRVEMRQALPDAIQLSALDTDDVAQLRAAIVDELEAELAVATLAVPFGDGRLLAEIRGRARVVAEAYGDELVRIELRALPADLERWRSLGLSTSAA